MYVDYIYAYIFIFYLCMYILYIYLYVIFADEGKSLHVPESEHKHGMRLKHMPDELYIRKLEERGG